jgi:hypothetical protein
MFEETNINYKREIVMIERIATAITAIIFLGSLVIGLITSTIDLISVAFTGSSLTGIPVEFFLALIILTPPIALILIFTGELLDKIFNLQNK